MKKVLILEDEVSIRSFVVINLKRAGYDVVEAGTGEEALELLKSNPDVGVAILDIMLPGIDGFEVCRSIRATDKKIGIIMLTARSQEMDKITGLMTGADDYMTKPVDEEELLLRISALLRRSKIAAEKRIVVGDTELDYNCMTVGEKGVRSDLPQKEFLLLFKLLSYPGQIFTRRQLMDEIWNLDCDTDERTVDVHINRLRDRYRKSEDFEIVTVRGLGYKAVCKK